MRTNAIPELILVTSRGILLRQNNRTNIATWGSTNTAVATVSTGLVRGVAAGSVTINGEDFSEPWAGKVCGSPAPACRPEFGAGDSALENRAEADESAGAKVIDMSYLNDPGCTKASWGILIAVHYQVLDQNGLTIS
jgi:Bacterial Ig-like domain (group 2)